MTNRYAGIREFSGGGEFEPLWLDQVQSRDDLLRHAFTPVDVSALEWNRVLEASGFLKFLGSL